MERKIGEIFKYNGEWYQCVESKQDVCTNCAFNPINSIRYNCSGSCAYKKVIFKKLEKVGEPYIEHDRSMDKDVVVQDYKLYNQHACYNGYEKILCFGLFDKDGIVTIKSKEPIKSLNCENSVEIEIKQTKEDMEENKLNLKPFDIQKAREGKPVCTRDGRKARIICFDFRIPVGSCIIAAIECGKTETIFYYNLDGRCRGESNNKCDLMMLPEKKEGWIIKPKDYQVYQNKEDAERVCNKDYQVIAKISWEE